MKFLYYSLSALSLISGSLASSNTCNCHEDEFYLYVRSANSGLGGKWVQPTTNYTDKGQLALVNEKPEYKFKISNSRLSYQEPSEKPWTAQLLESEEYPNQRELHFTTEGDGDYGFYFDDKNVLIYGGRQDWVGCDFEGVPNDYTSNVVLTKNGCESSGGSCSPLVLYYTPDE